MIGSVEFFTFFDWDHDRFSISLKFIVRTSESIVEVLSSTMLRERKECAEAKDRNSPHHRRLIMFILGTIVWSYVLVAIVAGKPTRGHNSRRG